MPFIVSHPNADGGDPVSTTRRTLLSALTALPATTTLAGLSAFAHATPSAAPPPWWLISPLGEGTTLVHGWSIDGLDPIVDGGAVLTVGHPQQGHLRIHVCLHNGNAKGFAYTELFDLIVMDQGHGVREVPGDLASVLTRIADQIRENELSQSAEIGDIAGMMTHAERVNAFGAGHLN